MNSIKCLVVALALLFLPPGPVSHQWDFHQLLQAETKPPCHNLAGPTLALHCTPGAPFWLLRHRKALKWFVLSSREFLTCSAARLLPQHGEQTLSRALPGATRLLSLAESQNPPPCHGHSLGWGGQTAISPENPNSPRPRVVMEIPPFRLYLRCLDLNMSLHSFILEDAPAPQLDRTPPSAEPGRTPAAAPRHAPPRAELPGTPCPGTASRQ